MKHRKVSVIMAVYNAEETIKEAIESILNQSFRDFEFVIINDASTDNTKKEIFTFRDSRISYLENEKNLGLTASLNIAICESQGDYIARQDADDISLPTRLEKQVGVLDSQDQVGLCGTNYAGFFQEKNDAQDMNPPDNSFVLRWHLLFHNKFGHSTVMFRRNLFFDMGGYNELYRLNQDYELWSCMVEQTDIVMLKERLCLFRQKDVAPEAIYYSNNEPLTPACQISVNNIKKISKDEYSNESCIFLHNCLGAHRLPEDGSILRKNLKLIGDLKQRFILKFSVDKANLLINREIIHSLGCLISPKIRLNDCVAIFFYMLRVDFCRSIGFLFTKAIGKVIRVFRVKS